jgi:regulatory protein
VRQSTNSTRSPRNAAMTWLARREHSFAELRTKLAARDYSSEEIDKTLKELAADGLVSDERFAESFIAARMRRGQGPVRIKMELEKRGVDAELIRLYTDDAGLKWHSLAKQVRLKKFGDDRPADFKAKARQMRFLEYRGFTGEQIRAAVDGNDY